MGGLACGAILHLIRHASGVILTTFAICVTDTGRNCDFTDFISGTKALDDATAKHFADVNLMRLRWAYINQMICLARSSGRTEIC